MKSNYQSAYLANSRQFTIYEVLVSKMTDKSVWIVNRAIFEGDSDIIKAVARKTTDHEYFSTIEAANNFLKPLLEKEIKRIESRYSAELMLMHLCNRVDELISKFPIIIETMHEAMSYGPSEADEEIEKAIKTIQDF